MKSYTIRRPLAASLTFAIGLASVPALRAQLPAPGQPGYQPIEVVTPQTQSFSVANLAGKPVRGANQEELSKISEFLIEPRSGRVPFAVVTAGPQTFRIVPMSALQPGTGADGLVVALDRARWDQIPTMSEQELLGAVSIDAARQQQLQQQFQLPAAEPPVENLMRATLMNERQVRVGNEQVGKVDDMVIDLHNRIAAPSVKMNSGYGPGDQNVLIHFSRLQVNPEPHSPITATVSLNELRAPGSGSLAPTGFPSGFNPGQPPARAAAMAVQQALDRDASLPRGTVQAMPETHIVLRGTVDNSQKKSDVERAAQQAAPGVQIVNQLTVRNP